MDKEKSQIIPFLLPLLLSLLLVHAPLFFFMCTHSFERTDAADFSNRQKVLFVNLNESALPQQIVDIQKPAQEKIPDKASAQSLYNSQVKEETVSQRFSKSNAAPATQAISKKAEPKSQNTQSSPPEKKALSMQEELKALVDEQKNKQHEKHIARFGKGEQQPLPFKSNIGAPGNTDDFLPGYKVGNRTYINTVANPHIAYFVELRRKYRFTWNPGAVLRNDVNRISRGTLTTIWGVSVDAQGKLAGVTLIKGSGHNGFDYEAMRTINDSAPYSHPPKEFLTPDGLLHMAWTFVVYL